MNAEDPARALVNEARAMRRERDAALTEVERLKAEVAKWREWANTQ